MQAALALQPNATPEACLLAQLYMIAGHPQDALDTARALRLAAPADADAHALFILLREAQGNAEEDTSELAQAYLNLLRCDPSSGPAVRGNAGCCLLYCLQVAYGFTVCDHLLESTSLLHSMLYSAVTFCLLCASSTVGCLGV